ncbi:hypothetical protein BT67DRAFT_443091 [Trichocladium antarcticum]|uniref:Uncharacterized protein n=1 Tax=Trichocladium antarcticum TaxID=1450529 RepID=A0AAN6ZBP3_9PEZI|nr:hypothetical protein BT67DRAFT_443091 [Trichocladium antarcticum]
MGRETKRVVSMLPSSSFPLLQRPSGTQYRMDLLWKRGQREGVTESNGWTEARSRMIRGHNRREAPTDRLTRGRLGSSQHASGRLLDVLAQGPSTGLPTCSAEFQGLAANRCPSSFVHCPAFPRILASSSRRRRTLIPRAALSDWSEFETFP